MRGCLAGRQADHVGFDPAFSIAQKGAAKAAGFVVRMCGKTEESKHLFLSPTFLICWQFLCNTLHPDLPETTPRHKKSGDPKMRFLQTVNRWLPITALALIISAAA